MEEIINSAWFWPAIALLFVWTTPWKGVALWRAAKNGHLAWFVALLLLNTLAILEIVYIFFFSKKNTVSTGENE